MKKNPSIHFIYPFNSIQGRGGVLEPIPTASGREAGYTPWAGRHLKIKLQMT